MHPARLLVPHAPDRDRCSPAVSHPPPVILPRLPLSDQDRAWIARHAQAERGLPPGVRGRILHLLAQLRRVSTAAALAEAALLRMRRAAECCDEVGFSAADAVAGATLALVRRSPRAS